jgi:hypothetical protein
VSYYFEAFGATPSGVQSVDGATGPASSSFLRMPASRTCTARSRWMADGARSANARDPLPLCAGYVTIRWGADTLCQGSYVREGSSVCQSFYAMREYA